MLRDVDYVVSDGLLAASDDKGAVVSVKIGASQVVADKPVLITGEMSADKIKAQLGLSPLATAAMDAVQFGANRIHCIPVQDTEDGENGTVEKTGAGLGGLTVDGKPSNAFGVIINITAQGGFNSAAFEVSVDGGYSFSDEVTMPLTGEYTLENTGLTLKFTEAASAEQKASSFMVGDVYSFATTAPTMKNSGVLAALDKLKQLTEEFEFVHIVGESGLATWQAVSTAQVELAKAYHKPVIIMMEAAYPDAAARQDMAAWAEQMLLYSKQMQNYDIQVVSAWGLLKRLDGSIQQCNLAGLVSGLYSRASVQTSIGKVREEAGFGIPKTQLLELLPAQLDNTIIEALDKAKYLTFREYDGLEYFYVYEARMMCPPDSDYKYAEDSRVKNKVIRLTRKSALQNLKDDIDLSDVQGELDARAKFMAADIEAEMVATGEITAVEVSIPEGVAEDFHQTEKMQVQVRYVSRGYIREVLVDIGRAAPGN